MKNIAGCPRRDDIRIIRRAGRNESLGRFNTGPEQCISVKANPAHDPALEVWTKTRKRIGIVINDNHFMSHLHEQLADL
jgi:hypothetical protein